MQQLRYNPDGSITDKMAVNATGEKIRMKKRLRTLLSLWILLLVLAGCGPEPAPAAAPVPSATPTRPATAVPAPPPTATAPAAEPAAAPGAITVGIAPGFEPFIFVKEGKLAGFDIDLLNAMAAASDFEVAYVISSFDELFVGLQSGKYDAAIGAITVTDERNTIVDFTAPYFTAGQAAVSFYNPGQGIAIRTDTPAITGVESLVSGLRVGVQSGTTGFQFASTTLAAEVVPFAEPEPALNALAAGELDAVIVDIPVIISYIRAHPEAGLRITGGPVTDESYAIAVNQKKSDVLALLNRALSTVRENGTYDQLFNRWFGNP
jgi:ABC-type amino acid transport substrate-binding protein